MNKPLPREHGLWQGEVQSLRKKIPSTIYPLTCLLMCTLKTSLRTQDSSESSPTGPKICIYNMGNDADIVSLLTVFLMLLILSGISLTPTSQGEYLLLTQFMYPFYQEAFSFITGCFSSLFLDMHLSSLSWWVPYSLAAVDSALSETLSY